MPETVPTAVVAAEQAPLPPVAAEPAPVAETAPPVTEGPAAEPDRSGLWIWVLGGVLVLAGLALWLLRRRRAEEEVYYYDETVEAAPVAVVTDPDPMVATPVVVTATEADQPALELGVRPVRAGVDGDEARVDFELTVDNHGSAAARDVQVSTWMIPAGSTGSEMEQMLIEPPANATLTALGAGETRRLDSSVTLPTSGIEGDSVLPVVVAEARYRLSDGSEETTHISFAVGVPMDGELAHFDTENPSGLHEGVEARPVETLEHA